MFFSVYFCFLNQLKRCNEVSSVAFSWLFLIIFFNYGCEFQYKTCRLPGNW